MNGVDGGNVITSKISGHAADNAAPWADEVVTATNNGRLGMVSSYLETTCSSLSPTRSTRNASDTS